MIIRKIKRNEYEIAIPLIIDTFTKFEAPNYKYDVVKTFGKAIVDTDYLDSLEMYGAYLDDLLIGIIALRNNNTHLALFFVDGLYQHQGVGKSLFNYLVENVIKDSLTVNSSIYGKKIYEKLGFKQINDKQEDKGIIYYPMVYYKNK